MMRYREILEELKGKLGATLASMEVELELAAQREEKLKLQLETLIYEIHVGLRTAGEPDWKHKVREEIQDAQDLLRDHEAIRFVARVIEEFQARPPKGASS